MSRHVILHPSLSPSPPPPPPPPVPPPPLTLTLGLGLIKHHLILPSRSVDGETYVTLDHDDVVEMFVGAGIGMPKIMSKKLTVVLQTMHPK